VYWLYAVSNDGKNTIASPPGFWNLGMGDGYRGLHLEDVVRSSLWKEEHWDFDPQANGTHSPADIMSILSQPLPNVEGFTSKAEFMNSTFNNHTSKPSRVQLEPLKHYGLVTGTFTLPICRSRNGFAISSVNEKDSANAPCICDGFEFPSKSWENPEEASFNATTNFVKWGMFYNNPKYGRMCQKRHDCKEDGLWRDRLNLAKDKDSVIEEAWSRCKKTFDHDEKGFQME
jgi:hypothetical protein